MACLEGIYLGFEVTILGYLSAFWESFYKNHRLCRVRDLKTSIVPEAQVILRCDLSP